MRKNKSQPDSVCDPKEHERGGKNGFGKGEPGERPGRGE